MPRRVLHGLVDEPRRIAFAARAGNRKRDRAYIRRHHQVAAAASPVRGLASLLSLPRGDRHRRQGRRSVQRHDGSFNSVAKVREVEAHEAEATYAAATVAKTCMRSLHRRRVCRVEIDIDAAAREAVAALEARTQEPHNAVAAAAAARDAAAASWRVASAEATEARAPFRESCSLEHSGKSSGSESLHVRAA